jgi:hypothetical protein
MKRRYRAVGRRTWRWCCRVTRRTQRKPSRQVATPQKGVSSQCMRDKLPQRRRTVSCRETPSASPAASSIYATRFACPVENLSSKQLKTRCSTEAEGGQSTVCPLFATVGSGSTIVAVGVIIARRYYRLPASVGRRAGLSPPPFQRSHPHDFGRRLAPSGIGATLPL